MSARGASERPLRRSHSFWSFTGFGCPLGPTIQPKFTQPSNVTSPLWSKTQMLVSSIMMSKPTYCLIGPLHFDTPLMSILSDLMSSRSRQPRLRLVRIYQSLSGSRFCREQHLRLQAFWGRARKLAVSFFPVVIRGGMGGRRCDAKERRDGGQSDLLRLRLDEIIDMGHPLVKLTLTIDGNSLSAIRGGLRGQAGAAAVPEPPSLVQGLRSSSARTTSPTRCCASAGFSGEEFF